MPTLFYKIFNKEVQIDETMVSQFLKELRELYDKFATHDDIDYINVLKNKIEHLLDDHMPKKQSKKAKKEYEKIEDFLEEINEFIADYNARHKEEKLIDVVKKIDSRYKNYDKIKEEKLNKYKKVWIKKDKIKYEKELIKLQVELLKLQRHIKDKWEKLLIIFEWRDAAWKWGTIKRFREYLNPRWARVVALEKPSELEKTQWYFERYIGHLPNGWEMTFFDRSWYNRAWVEPVMWFVSKKSYKLFLQDAPRFEKMLVDSGVTLVKFYFSVSKDEQAKRFDERRLNPLKQYKLSPIDQESQNLWDKYTLAEYMNFSNTHKKDTPWTVINSNDKKKARINAIKYVLNQFDYPEKISDEELKIDREIVYPWDEKVEKLKKSVNLKDDLFA